MGVVSLPLTAEPIRFVSGEMDTIELASAEKLIRAARKQLGVTTSYDPSYMRIGYPNGDVPEDRGVCIDVVIRAYRSAFTFDFQKVIHEDMVRSFAQYPKIWGLKKPDRNIDHRRVPNMETWLARQGHEVKGQDWKVGDLMTCRLPGNLPHIVVVARDAPARAPLLRVVHNIGRGAREESILMTGLSGIRHFRFYPEKSNR